MRASTLERIRKLLALAESPNEHEAASALKLAQDLMRKWGVSERDLGRLDEDALEVADETTDDYREFVAGMAAHIYGCRAVRKDDGIGFRGRASQVSAALRLYRRARDLYAVSVKHIRLIVAERLYDLSEQVWRFWWWNGFAKSMRGRRPKTVPAIQPMPAPAKKKKRASRKSAGTPAAAEPEVDAPPPADIDPNAIEISGDEIGDEQARAWESSGAPERAGRDKDDVMSEMERRARQLARDIDVRWFTGIADNHGSVAGAEIPFDGVAEERLLTTTKAISE